MRFINVRRIAASGAVALAVALPLAVQGSVHPASAASSVQALVAQAEQNTNSVNTIIHQDTNAITTPRLTVTVSAHGTEDEVRNREQDSESVNVTTRTAAGKVQHVHYTVDVIFVQGVTYYRESFAHNKWLSRKGSTFLDPYTGGFKRGRTTVSLSGATTLLSKTYKFQQVGQSGGQTQVRANVTTSSTKGTVDLWISEGSKPYVVREDQNLRGTGTNSGTLRIQTRFGPFNTPVVIQAPTTQGTT